MPVFDVVALSAVLFAIGAVGLLVRRDPLVMIMCVEIMWSAANLAFIAFARQWANAGGQVFMFLVVTVAAAEVAVALALVVLGFRARNQRANVDDLNQMHG